MFFMRSQILRISLQMSADVCKEGAIKKVQSDTPKADISTCCIPSEVKI